jgi:hypothetical protein
MTGFTIIGAGMAGLLAGAMLQDECVRIAEAQPGIPNNHHALLRFKTHIVGDALNIPFKPVKVIKAIVGGVGNPVGDALAYSLKTNGTATLRSSVTAQGAVETRYIAPPNLIARMVNKVGPGKIQFGTPMTTRPEMEASPHPRHQDFPVISTMPMPALMKLLNYSDDRLDFNHRAGWVITQELKDVDACGTLYFPATEHLWYRASITGDRLIIEGVGSFNGLAAGHIVSYCLEHFGMDAQRCVGSPDVKEQRYAKILPVDEAARRRFILWASEHYSIYSLGRFATWRPGLLLDDLVNDVRTIQRIQQSNNYDHRKH